MIGRENVIKVWWLGAVIAVAVLIVAVAVSSDQPSDQP